MVDWVERLGELADQSARRAREFHKLTGQHDPILHNVTLEMEDGTKRHLGDLPLSEIRGLRR